MVALYGTPTVAPGRSDNASVWLVLAGLIWMLNAAEALVPEASAACAEKGDVPTVVGVPEMVPVAAAIVKPGGREPEIRLKS